MSKLDKDTVLESFTKAYTKANGKAPTIEAKGGWYSVDGGKNVRLAQLDEMATELSAATKSAKASPAKEKAPAAKAKPAAKKAAAPKETPAPKKKAPAAKKAKAAKTFSVRDFYIQQIMADNSGAKAPR
ncbi:hypothetical protein [Glaciecola petra]|uniref:Uncharacterized protein n=1 Tax=Glaciecola petra TaxID=3075602 RepID=A0ABU2ZQ27_9ALTE|nr:hypothetical protein [Aestuariibacter sp. P117]MDT0594444.1 hypothetical protein [Aestuariibacter sp. P117]